MREAITTDFPVLDPDELYTNTGLPDYHAVQTIQLGELINDGVFTWNRVPWRDAAYSQEQYERLCIAFEARYFYREIGITPVYAWFKRLEYRLVYELMPKYRPMYAQLDNGNYNPLQHGGEYGKRRDIDSQFPETLLSGTDETYASSGKDSEWETVKMDGALTENYALYVEQFRAIDAMILDELETMFSCLFTTNANGL